jgi:hypothetical protein
MGRVQIAPVWFPPAQLDEQPVPKSGHFAQPSPWSPSTSQPVDSLPVWLERGQPLRDEPVLSGWFSH